MRLLDGPADDGPTLASTRGETAPRLALARLLVVALLCALPAAALAAANFPAERAGGGRDDSDECEWTKAFAVAAALLVLALPRIARAQPTTTASR
jgi:hypothetical protein